MSSRKLRFDGWVLDPESGDLERGGIRTRLQEQPMQVLRELVAHAGSVVTREQLIALLWPTGVVDFDTGLNTVIRKLRSALGDTSDTPRYIETLPRRGYRFIGTLDPDPEAPSAASPAVPGPAASDSSPLSHPAAGLPPEAALASKPTPRGSEQATKEQTASFTATTTPPVRRSRLPAQALIAVLAVAGLVTGVYALWRARSGAGITSVRVQAPAQSGLPANVAVTGAVAFSPPPQSVAVLPFANISGDKEQEYFSDGLTEELLNSLARIDGLQVVGRTSSFYFKGKDVDLGTVGHRLNVAAVLEGSVRRSAHTVRVSARLTSTVAGFQLWSETYDRDLGDVLRLQSEIANAVAAALKVKLVGNAAAKLELGGTRNPAAFDAYLRASRIYWSVSDSRTMQEAVAGFTEAVAQDPDYALARAARSIALLSIQVFDPGPSGRSNHEAAQAEALKAVQLAPTLADSHLALALVAGTALDFARAQTEFERAVALGPGSERVLRDYSAFAVFMGHFDSGIAAARRAVLLNPLDGQSYQYLGQALALAKHYDEAIAAYNNALALVPNDTLAHALIGSIYYALGNFERARSACEIKRENFVAQVCLATAYEKLARHRDAQAELAKLRASAGDDGAYFYAEIYAQWGRPAESLEWLNTAMRLHSSRLVWLKVDSTLDPVRKEPRFQAIERELKFPD